MHTGVPGSLAKWLQNSPSSWTCHKNDFFLLFWVVNLLILRSALNIVQVQYHDKTLDAAAREIISKHMCTSVPPLLCPEMTANSTQKESQSFPDSPEEWQACLPLPCPVLTPAPLPTLLFQCLQNSASVRSVTANIFKFKFLLKSHLIILLTILATLHSLLPYSAFPFFHKTSCIKIKKNYNLFIMSTVYYLFIPDEMTKFQDSRNPSLFCSMCQKCLKQFLA